MLHIKHKSGSRTKPQCIKSINLIKGLINGMGKNMGVFQTLNHDTVNGWEGHMTSSVTNTLSKKIVWVGGKTSFELNMSVAYVKQTRNSRGRGVNVKCIVQQRQEMWSLCDRRCNAKQCTVLWMGRQVLYEWRGSCDRSTSRSRYFSLTVNKRTQGISSLKQ